MKKLKLKLFILAISLISASCATYYSEVPQSEPHSSIKSLTRDKLFNPPVVGILEINGLPVDNMWKGYGAKRRLSAGQNNIYVTAYTGSSLTAYSPISFEAKANTDYVVTYEGNVNSVVFIVMEEKTKNEIARVEAQKTPAPRNNDVFIPIFIPAK